MVRIIFGFMKGGEGFEIRRMVWLCLIDSLGHRVVAANEKVFAFSRFGDNGGWM